MKRLFTFLLLLILSMTWAPTAVRAHDESWLPEPDKSAGSSPGIQCKAVGDYQGHRYTWTYDMVGDGDEPIAKERAWLESWCDRNGRQDVTGWFKYREGLDIPDSSIRVTFKHTN